MHLDNIDICLLHFEEISQKNKNLIKENESLREKLRDVVHAENRACQQFIKLQKENEYLNLLLNRTHI